MINLFMKNKDVYMYAPVTGSYCAIEKVKDSMFSSKMLGDGFAVIPEEGEICAPCDGSISMIAPSLHAFGITSKNGAEILVHIGLDTVNLQGKGFHVIKCVHERVKANEPIVRMDMEYMKKQNLDLTIPIVITNSEAVTVEKFIQEGKVTKNTKILKITKK